MRSTTLSLAALLVVLGCGGPTSTPAPAARRVEILSPREGETVQGPNVTVRLAAHDFLVVRAGDMTPNSGHHHVFLDRDLSSTGAPIPAEPNRIVHLGTGASEVVLEGVPPGPHVLITMVGDHAHVPLEPLVVDTVRFVVR